jgi:hypothetical protein
MCHELNLVGEVDAHVIMPLLHNLFTCGHASQPLDTESGKVPQNGELIHLGEWLVHSVSLPQIFFDLFSQLFLPANFVFCFWLEPRGIKCMVNIILLTL